MRLGVIFQWGGTLKVSIQLSVTSRHRHDITKRLLKVTFIPNTQTIYNHNAKYIDVCKVFDKKNKWKYPGNATIMKHNPPEAPKGEMKKKKYDTLRKHTYSNILNILTTKKWKFSDKNSDISHTSGQNIDCGYSLEPPRWGGSNEYPKSMFLGRNKKNNIYPCKPQFY